MMMQSKCHRVPLSGKVVITGLLFVFVTLAKDAAGQKELRILLSGADKIELFYKEWKEDLFWFKKDHETDGDIRSGLIRIFREEAAFNGLDSLKYLSMLPLKADLSNLSPVEAYDYDRKFTNAALTYCLDLYQGDRNIKKLVGSDEVSRKYEEQDIAYIVHLLSKSNSVTHLNSTVWSLEPHQQDYTLLKAELKKQMYLGDSVKAGAVRTSLNFYRWFSHFKFDKLVVVNIASAELKYYENDSLKLGMAVVVGKPSTMTPRFVTYCDQVILYPYWNVPRSIAVNEILPVCKKSLMILDVLKMQVIDSKGRIVDPRSLDWQKFTKNNFPLRFRQSTGCDNALGVIKFNLTSSYNVYLHDTNLKSDFQARSRYFSHGCIRVQKPVLLANSILGKKLDEAFLEASIKGQQPVVDKVPRPVPVFILYMMADVNADGTIAYFSDVYHLF